MRGPRWITEAEVEGGVIPEGGTTDQVLAKQSDADYDLKWVAGGGGGGIGGSIANEQVGFGDGTDVAGSDDLKWDDAAKTLKIRDGSNPVASAGTLALCNQFSVRARSNDGSFDVAVLSSSNSDKVTVGDNAVHLDLIGDDVAIHSAGGVTIVPGAGAGLEVTKPVFLDDILVLTPMSAPSNPYEGIIYADTNHHIYYYNGTAWKQLDN